MCRRLGNINDFSLQLSRGLRVDCSGGRIMVKRDRQSWVLEGQFLHEEVNPGVHLKAVKVVGISLQPHEEATVRHVGRAERTNMDGT